MIHLGDCIEVLKSLPENSVDAIVTDPPAGISFMNKDWDNAKGGREQWIAWLAEVMRECMRVMKPGAHGLVWAIPRTSHWTGTALEQARFEVRDVVTHLFGTGFPKSLDISKAIDKAAGVEREVVGRHIQSKQIRKLGSSLEGSKDGSLAWQHDLTAPATPEAKQWEGFGTALKPACEFWFLVRKPCSEPTVAKNVLKWGTGGINVDAGRVPGKLEGDPNRFSKAYSMGNGHEGYKRPAHENYTTPVVRSEGRFPANLLLDETAAELLDEQSGVGKSSVRNGGKGGSGIYKDSFGDGAVGGFTDTGGASRFFYVAKASKREKNAGLEEMPITQTTGGGGQTNCGDKFGSIKAPAQNFHPTVKPIKLMEYLIKLITPPKGTVLDPFMGSGSTGVAAKRLGFKFIGVEREKDYFEIAKRRMELK